VIKEAGGQRMETKLIDFGSVRVEEVTCEDGCGYYKGMSLS
jgi:hypothetical protein